MASNLVLPGTSLGAAEKNEIGTGTHIHGQDLCASIAGPVQSSKTTKPPTTSVQRATGPLLLEVGTVILGRITRTNARQANVAILALGSNGEHNVSSDPFPALIRQQDIRATEIAKVKVTESFRVGDIVRAVVISLGDERSYYLSTARNEFGVVMATSEWGNSMYPVSWREFEDPEMGIREVRKVAKPI
ncbi:hypothetical protein BST61_g8048 [Cercospora zeina]